MTGWVRVDLGDPSPLDEQPNVIARAPVERDDSDTLTAAGYALDALLHAERMAREKVPANYTIKRVESRVEVVLVLRESEEGQSDAPGIVWPTFPEGQAIVEGPRGPTGRGEPL
jgi:hypothetical protein